MQSIKIFFSFLFLFPVLVFSWNISSESLLEKLQREPPSWIRQRITSDLSYFQKNLSSKKIDLCLENLKTIEESKTAGLVRIRFIHGQASFEPLFSLTTEQNTSLQEFLSALYLLDSLSSLPDLDFILSVCPSFNRPILLTKTSVPIFAVSKERQNPKVVLIPRLWDSHREKLFHRLSCDWDKKRDTAFWRGFATDGPYGFFEWDCKPRARLCLQSGSYQDLLDASIVPSSDLENPIKNWLGKLSLLSPFISPEDQGYFKYLLSLDGKASPSSLEWQLFSQSLIFKTESNQIEWFYEALDSGVHYVSFHPLGYQLIGNILWAKSHDDEAKAIAEKGYLFAIQHLLDEEVFVYLFHVLQAYSRLSTAPF